ncbi:MAG: cytochrome c oxidase subunit II [Bacteroidetes bacterium]|nr:cytochrome c oxidase subunit II [Bacteroidota bacterium]
MFSNASNFVHGVDKAFLIIFGISLFFLILLTTIMIVFVVKYNKKRHPKAVQIKDSSLLEFTWTAIPMILVLFMFYVGWEGFLPMRQAPADALNVKVIGRMWKWTFEYPGKKQSDTLVLPINKAARMELFSKDVIHGFFIPTFRVKEDVVPGKKNYTWFIPGELGDFDLLCSAYCGLSHSYMSAVVRIVPEDVFTKWLAKLPVSKVDENNEGYKLVEKNGCFSCHSIDGAKLVGPTFKDMYGSSIDVMTNGTRHKITVDDEYIKNSILDPNKDVVDGYAPGIMKSYTGLIKDKDIPKISEYFKTLKAK